MSVALDPVTLARRNAQSARQRMLDTIATLQRRLKPGNLAAEANDAALSRARTLADSGVQAVKARPVTVAAILLAVVAFVFRREIYALLRGQAETETASDEYSDYPEGANA